jgi:hypothetical protein
MAAFHAARGRTLRSVAAAVRRVHGAPGAALPVLSEAFVEAGGAARAPVGHKGVAGDHRDPHPDRAILEAVR